MEKEIQATVKLWSDQIRSGAQDIGDGTGDAMASLAKMLAGPVTDEQIAIFEKALTVCLRAKILVSGTWDPAQPERGAGMRGLFTDYHPDGALSTAARLAGINQLSIPIKSQTFTCPGFVIYAFGYSAKRQRLEIEP